jgi:hypothetical protein
MFGKKKERHKSGEALNIEENGTRQQSSLNPGTSLREQGDIIEGRDELTPETRWRIDRFELYNKVYIQN